MNNYKFITTIERNPGMNESSPLILGSNDCCCSVSKLCPTLCDPMGCSTLGFLVLHHLPEFDQTNIHWVGDAIQPFHPLSSPCPPTFSLSQHQSLFQWVSSLHQVAKALELHPSRHKIGDHQQTRIQEYSETIGSAFYTAHLELIHMRLLSQTWLFWRRRPYNSEVWKNLT